MITEFAGSFFTDQPGGQLDLSSIKDMEHSFQDFDSKMINKRRRKSSEDDFVVIKENNDGCQIDPNEYR